MNDRHLFSPFVFRDQKLRNRIVISPMCQYVATEGMANDWHEIHLGKFAQGGAGLVMTEATAVTRDGRISHGDLGIWSDDHVPGLKRICDFISAQGAVPGIQLSHAGRKGSAQRPWHGNGPLLQEDLDLRGERSWQVMAPSAVPVDTHWHTPHAMTAAELEGLAGQWEQAALRAAAAGFRVAEIHCAHGYLLHQFLSPVTNLRGDAYGGDIAGRMRYPLEIVSRVRRVWPAGLPLFVRISAVDGAEDTGWDLEDSVLFARELAKAGADVVDCSSGGLLRPAMLGTKVRAFPGYQVPYAEKIRREAAVQTMAVGLIYEPAQADGIVRAGQADLIAIGREALWNPNWPMRAAQELGHDIFPDIGMSYAFHLSRREKLMKSLKSTSPQSACG
ncbi:NADH:flavin oxidoreductase/NADH oxidase [Oceanibacterium hippocampi]|nr:NADH:flavin oxidoreductase/NADH oxidase [Oceanibacterium hippocampi]